MTTPAPDGFRPEWLAGYADGELDPDARAVERWLADHPATLADLNAQLELSPANGPFWEKAEPPEPSAANWAAVRRGIDEELDADSPDPVHRRGWRVAAWALAGLTAAAAAVAWLVFAPPTSPPRPPAPKPVEVAEQAGPDVAPMPRPRARPPVAEIAALPMASDDDVILDRVPEFPAGWLPVGAHPLAGVMSLASEEELQVAEVVSSPVWPTGGPKMTTGPGDAPMIYAAKPR